MHLFFRSVLALYPLIFLFSACGGDDESPINCSVSGPALIISSLSPATCVSTGSIVVAVSGGEAPFTFSIDGANFQSSEKFSALAPGTYVITVQDTNKCSATTSVNLTLESDLKMTFETTEVTCGISNGTLTVTATGGSGNYSYSIDGSVFTTNPFFSNLGNGEHNITISDGLCEEQGTALVVSGVSFESSVSAIIKSNCAVETCHVTGSQFPDMTDFKNIQENAVAIRTKVNNLSMPPAGSAPLQNSDIQAIVCWVTDGAPDN